MKKLEPITQKKSLSIKSIEEEIKGGPNIEEEDE